MSWFLSLILAGAMFGGSPWATVSEFASGALTENSGVSVQDESEISEQTFPLNPDGRIEVANINGEIVIEAWDRAEVKLVSKKTAKTKERLADIEVKVRSTAETLKIEVDYKRWKGKWIKDDNLNVDFSLMVPKTAVLDEIESVNGSIKVSGMNSVTKASSVNGSVRGIGLKGDVELSTVNGSVVAEFVEVTLNSVVSLSTVNGSAEARLPSNVDAIIKADTVNGSITNSYGLPVRKGEYVGRDLYGKIGNGASKIRLNSVNGGLKISRLDDGLPLNPVVDLLPSKTSDDFDDSFNGRLDAPEAVESELTRELARVAPVISREAARSAAALAAETAKIDSESLRSALSSVELAKIDEEKLAAELARIRQNIFGNRMAPHIDEDTKSIQVSGIPNIEINANGANVNVKAWDRDEVKYTVTRLARGQMSPVENINFNEEKGNILLEVRLVPGAANDDILEHVWVEIYAPQKSNFEITTDREIRVQGIDGRLTIHGKTGTINVRDSGGSLDVSSKSSLVRVIGFKGTVKAQGMKGDMYLEGSFERISSKMESGEVFLTVEDGTGASIRAKGINPDGKLIKTMDSGGLKLEEKGDGLWKLGDGKAEYTFAFTTGKLLLRTYNSIAAR